MSGRRIIKTSVTISIHTLRVEGDLTKAEGEHLQAEFQSTPSAWRVTRAFSTVMRRWMLFQSTPSAWRVTRPPLGAVTAWMYFNPHPPRGG